MYPTVLEKYTKMWSEDNFGDTTSDRHPTP